ncbi:MAG: DUF4115 domain-containing protein [Deltaproteobacteria bacterium]|nr:DUF4115 domain-containing protein [Deltaproteobacteria bacterium]
METLGSYLKEFREKKGIRLEEIASITKIHLHNLQLLENSQWDQLPPDPFIKGFIAAYAKYVGLDPKEIAAKYAEELQRKKEPETVPSDPAKAATAAAETNQVIANAKGVPVWKLISTATAVIAVVATVALIYIGKDDRSNGSQTDSALLSPPPSSAAPLGTSSSEPLSSAVVLGEQVPSVAQSSPSPMEAPNALTAAEQQATTLTDNRAPAAAELPPAQPSPVPPANHTVVVEGKERSWMKVVVDEKAPVEFFLRKGEKVTYAADSKIKIVLGNATGSKIYHNGELNQGVKYQGTIRFYLFPSDAKFPQDAPSERTPSSKVIDAKKVRKAPAESSKPADGTVETESPKAENQINDNPAIPPANQSLPAKLPTAPTPTP